MIPLLGIYLKKHNTLIQKNIYTPMFTAVLFTIAKIWKQPKCPSVNDCIKKLWCIHNGILRISKKERILIFFNSMVGARDYYAKWNKTVNERQISYDLTYTKKSNEQNKQTSEIESEHRNTEQTYSCKRGVGGAGWKNMKGLVKENICMTIEHGQQVEDWLWEWGAGWEEGRKLGWNWDNCSSINKKWIYTPTLWTVVLILT